MLNPEVGAENTKISKYSASTIHYLECDWFILSSTWQRHFLNLCLRREM